MPIAKCPACGESIRVPDHAAQIACPTCDAKINVKKPQAKVRAPEAPPPPSTFTARPPAQPIEFSGPVPSAKWPAKAIWVAAGVGGLCVLAVVGIVAVIMMSGSTKATKAEPKDVEPPAPALSKSFRDASSAFLSESLAACNLLDTGPSISNFSAKCGKVNDAFSGIDARGHDEESARTSLMDILYQIRQIETTHHRDFPDSFSNNTTIRNAAREVHRLNKERAGGLRETIRAWQDRIVR